MTGRNFGLRPLPEIAKAKIVITNYHAFKRRETMDVSKVGKALLLFSVSAYGTD
jgi:hypothetical protein